MQYIYLNMWIPDKAHFSAVEAKPVKLCITSHELFLGFYGTVPMPPIGNISGKLWDDIHLFVTYTPCPEKKSLEYFRHNFIKYWPIFEILSLLQSAENLQCSYR